MEKIYRLSIVSDYEPDENNYLEWEDEYGLEDEDKDEDFKPRTEEELKALLKREFIEWLNGGNFSDIVSIEIIERETNA